MKLIVKLNYNNYYKVLITLKDVCTEIHYAVVAPRFWLNDEQVKARLSRSGK